MDRPSPTRGGLASTSAGPGTVRAAAAQRASVRPPAPAGASGRPCRLARQARGLPSLSLSRWLVYPSGVSLPGSGCALPPQPPSQPPPGVAVAFVCRHGTAQRRPARPARAADSGGGEGEEAGDGGLAGPSPVAAPPAGGDGDPLAPPPPPPAPAFPGSLLPVPWGFDTVVGVMALWLVAFWALGYIVVPGLLELLGITREALSPRSQAVVHLGLDCGELAVTAGVLARCLRRYRPRELGWFRARAPPAVRAARLAAAEAAAVSAGPRAAGLAAALPAPVRAALSGWVLPLAATVAAFPLVDAAAARAHALFPIVDAAADALAAGGGGGGGGSTGAGLLEAAIAAGDPATSGLYFAVVALCAPLWEEAIFRGFLLPSLAATLRPPAAVAASALVFALAHFSVPRFVPLLLLGGLFGALFVHTRSLGTAVAAHALWNVYIFAHLLTAAGGGG